MDSPLLDKSKIFALCVIRVCRQIKREKRESGENSGFIVRKEFDFAELQQFQHQITQRNGNTDHGNVPCKRIY